MPGGGSGRLSTSEQEKIAGCGPRRVRVRPNLILSQPVFGCLGLCVANVFVRYRRLCITTYMAGA